ncbi:enhancer of polycomb homolog 1 isoform X2 [Zootermopsis nevadensis]|uniref:enhancer of polycomb homolog 1 isoform X2 n=1 Tax=Zootermopsis nevadensis TaxID=136037 RepID=UPI000B8E2F72|nr:enhancer of polycomb homolog 1 isoform X2 [Zootermopsis nevadensis]
MTYNYKIDDPGHKNPTPVAEHHLQRAICTGLIIPTPEVVDLADAEAYNKIYPLDYKLPRQLIHMQPFAMEQDIPDYDMDSEDEKWVHSQAKKMDLLPLKFEEMMDRLEKGSGQTVVTLQEAKSLLKEDDDLIIAVYDYWLNKRLKTQHPLIPTVKTEHRLGSAANNPYLAFRRRTEKMQTRKNRKNDETSYEKMLKLRRDLSRAVTLLELVKRREKTKREHLHLTVEIYEKRYQASDFSGQMLAEVSALKTPRPAFAPLFTNQFGINHQNWLNKLSSKDEVVPRKEKRQYKRRKHKTGVGAVGIGSHGHRHSGCGSMGSGTELLGYNCTAGGELLSSEDEGDVILSGQSPQSEDEEPDPSEGPFTFRRKKYCNYHAPLSGGLGNWPWCSRDEGGLADRRYRYCLTSISNPEQKCIGFARRRIGRGGRVILDRASTEADDIFAYLDFTVHDSGTVSRNNNQFLSEIKNDWLHFRPKTPPLSTGSEGEDADVDIFNSSREEPLLCGLPGVDGSTLTVEVETLSDNVFNNSSTMSSLDNTSSNVTTTELNLSELMSNSPSQLFEFPPSVTDDESLDILERLGIASGSLSSPDETKSGITTEDSSRKLDSSSPPVSSWDPVIGCSKFILQPSSSLRFSTAHDPFSLSPISASAVTNHTPPTSTPNQYHPSALHHHSHHHFHHHHHHRRRHRHHLSTVTSTSNFLTSPLSTRNSNSNISGFSNGGLVLNHEPSTSVSGGFSMAMPSTSASENVLIRASGAASTGFGGGMQNLTNGPISTEFPGTSRSRLSVHTSRSHHQHQSNSCYTTSLQLGHQGLGPSTLTHPATSSATLSFSGNHHRTLIATQQILSATGNFQHNYNRMVVTTKSTVSVTTPPVMASAAGSDGGGDIIATANIKQEPGVAGEVTLNSGEGLEGDVNSKDKASNQLCVDKKQLVRKNNSLPMEVT